MLIAQDITEIKTILNQFKEKKIGLVPTMGALHEGHISIIQQAKKECDIVIVSIFVNPTQFNNKEDLIKYPNRIEEDIAKLETESVDLLFIPKAEEIYNKNHSVSINENSISLILEGKERIGHFSGVLLIITKLFNIIKPHKAFFGLKDYQQYILIKKLSLELNFAIEVIGCETKREKTGLAMSSRNFNLSIKEKDELAPLLYKSLIECKVKINKGEEQEKTTLEAKRNLKEKFTKLDYLEIYDNRIFVAAFINKVRLIDNIKL